MRRLIFAKFLVIAVFVFLFAGSSVVFGQNVVNKGPKTYYISPYGNNMNDGSEEKPWASPAYGCKKMKAGDTMIIQSGHYLIRNRQEVISPPSGRYGAWITIKGDEKGRPILFGDSNLLAVINVAGRSYVRIENLEITSRTENSYGWEGGEYGGGVREGIEAGGSYGGEGYVSNIILSNIEIHNVEETGLRLAGNSRYVMFEKLNIHHTGRNCIDIPSKSGSGMHNVVITESTLSFAGHFSRGKDQPSSYKDPDGLRADASGDKLEIRKSLIEHNRGDGIDSRCSGTAVIQTIVANNSADNLKFRGVGSRAENTLIYGDGDGNPDNGKCGSIVIDSRKPGKYEFINVTVDDNPARQGDPVYIQAENKTPITLVLKNCIFVYGNRGFNLGDSVTLKAVNNIFYRKGQSFETAVHAGGKDYLTEDLVNLGKGNFSADPMFKNPAWGERGDYQLMPGSPAIDNGSDQDAPRVDLDGKPRPKGKAPELGCYETRR
ncbi:MAG: right-handed parallel beta-helix repeat-containing protein [Firmicutes bacterium]|nr:right-handed parallel beta-helix repeat-containing protein [Bacillota bacterium]